MSQLMVGCPVRDRAWALPLWFEHIETAAAAAGMTPHYVFAGDPSTDWATFTEIDFACHARGRNRDVLEAPEVKGSSDRVWNSTRFHHMVTLRNRILTHVRGISPAWFWSVDSDIFVAADTLTSALDCAGDRFGAVGSRCYMSAGTRAPSYGLLTPLGGLTRPDAEGCIPVDVIMAVKLMSPAAYAVDYVHHRQGEDIGWSIAARAAGVRLGWDGRTISKHVMDAKRINLVDDRAGF